MNNSELELFVRLVHPDPKTHPSGFAKSLPDEFIDTYINVKNYTVQMKRDLVQSYLYYRIIPGDKIVQHLVEFYGRKERI